MLPERGTGGFFVGCMDRKLNASLLFDIVDERKRNAGGVCPGGSRGQPRGQPKHSSYAFILREVNALVETPERMISRQFSTQCDHFSGEFIHQKSCFKLESLILAQNERWRQA